MRVIFDISPVGYNPRTRTGLARYAWSLARFLHKELGNNLSFSAVGSIEATLQNEKLLATYPELVPAINPVSKLARNIHKLNYDIDSLEIDRNNALFLKLQKQSLTNILRLFNLIRQPIEPNQLQKCSIFHSSYARIPVQVRNTLPNRHVITVHDLTPLILDKKYFIPGQIGITSRIIDSIQPDDWVITVSESTRNDLCNRCSINSDKVVVIPNAADKSIFYHVSDSNAINSVRQKYKIPDGHYILSLHSLAAHKNLNHLISSFKNLLTQEKIHDLTLVICGGQEQSVDEVIKQFNLTQSDLKSVHFTGFVPDEDLASLYSGAMAFIFPSLYEGFGLPVLEAMQCGCPVITSNTSSLPEVVGKAGFLVSPTDQDTLCESILQLYLNDSLRSHYSQSSVNRTALFSWEKTVDSILELYNKVI